MDSASTIQDEEKMTSAAAAAAAEEEDDVDFVIPETHKCGYGPWKPECMQRSCNKPQVLLFAESYYYFVLGESGLYSRTETSPAKRRNYWLVVLTHSDLEVDLSPTVWTPFCSKAP